MIVKGHVTNVLSVYLDPTEKLIQKVRHPVMVQLDPNHPTQVSIHQLHHNIAVGGNVCVSKGEGGCEEMCMRERGGVWGENVCEEESASVNVG